MKMKHWLQSPCPLFGFIVNFCDDSILLVHKVVVNLFQLPERIKNTQASQAGPGRKHELEPPINYKYDQIICSESVKKRSFEV